MQRRRPRKFWRQIGIPVIGVLLALFLVIGFFSFASHIAKATAPTNPRADAIVVLTGAPARIDQGLRLLDEGRAGRLLISGVNPNVTSDDLTNLVDGDLRGQFGCCVDLGRDANDTLGNAAEARSWVAAHSFTSLIVVTSNYHMPRSLSELSGAMPHVTLIPYPVSNPELHFSDWWKDQTTFTLLVREYGKYLVAKARQLLSAVSDPRAGQ